MKRILIISDLHVTNDEVTEEGNSLVSAHPRASKQGNAMFDGIVSCIELEALKIDWVICPGDLGDQAEKIGLEYAWKKLEEIKNKIQAKYLIGTAGNHDFDSRLQNGSFDPSENLQELRPIFPGLTQNDCDKYFARKFCIYEDDNTRIVNVNSSAYHGINTTTGEEYLHGRISSNTIEAICEEIKSTSFDINILLTHHHLMKNDHIYDNDISEMNGAGRLLQKLSETTKSPWLVFHGHQHYPELDYGRGSSLAPIVLSAGSFSAKMSGTLASASPNQFYIIELEERNDTHEGWFPCGVVKSWHWSPEGKWSRSPIEHRIPYGAGFGCKINPSQAAKKITNILDKSIEPYINLEDVFSIEPQLKFLLPTDLNLLFHTLKSLDIKVTESRNIEETTFRRSIK